jgi:hypothetical protein
VRSSRRLRLVVSNPDRPAEQVRPPTYSVTNLAVKDAARRYSSAEVVAVSREVESGLPSYISTSYVGARTSRCE